MNRSLAFLAALVILTSPAEAQRPAPAADARAGIAATWGEFLAHWKLGHAPESVAAFFTDDAINMIPGKLSHIGHTAIEKNFAAFFATNKVSDIHQTTDEVQASGNTAYERGTFFQTVIPTTGKISVQRSRYLAVWARQADGKWKCTRFLINDLPST